MIHPPARSGTFAILVLTVLLACKAETFGGDDLAVDPAELSVVAGVPIAGNFITISAPWMAGLPDRITVVIDDGHAEMSLRVDGATDRFLVRLSPTLPAGSHELLLERGANDRVSIGRVSTGGFSEQRTVAGSIFGPSQLIPSLPGVVGVGPANGCGGEARVLDARNARLRTVPNSSTCTYGIGASYVPGRFLIYQPWSGGNWIRMGPHLGTVATDSLHVWGNWWPTHELAPGLYLQDTKSQTSLVDTAGGGVFALSNGAYGHPEHIAFSEDGAWAVSSHSRSAEGLLIVDRAARTYHWGPGWLANTRAVFLPTGELVAYGWRQVAPGGGFQEVLAHVDVVTGAMIDSVKFADAGSPYDLPVALTLRPWIVLPGFVNDHIELSIRDAVTLQEIAHPRSAAFASSCYSWSTFWVVEDVPLHRFYVVGNDCYDHVPVLTFQLPD